MNFRNPVFMNEEGWIEVELEHPKYGWVPFTLDPNDQSNPQVTEPLKEALGDYSMVAPYEPPVRPLIELKADLSYDLGISLNAVAQTFTAGIPEAEIQSWPVKTVEAQTVLQGGTSAMIEAEALMTGEDPLALAQVVIEAAKPYAVASATLAGLRRSLSAAINAAQTPEDLAAVSQKLSEVPQLVAQAVQNAKA